MRRKWRAVGEVLAVLATLEAFRWWWADTSFAHDEWVHLGWGYTYHAVMVAVSVALVALARRGFTASGLNLKFAWKANVRWGLFFGGLLAAPTAVALACGWVQPDVPRLWVSTLVFQVVGAGLGEEILHRGYIQSRANAAFGRPYNALGIRFGLGLVLASLAFALVHLLNPFFPFQGSYGLDWTAALIALNAGTFHGFLREKFGSVLAPAIVHGSTFWWSFTLDGTARYIAVGIGWSLCWVVMFSVLAGRKAAGDDESSPSRGATSGRAQSRRAPAVPPRP